MRTNLANLTLFFAVCIGCSRNESTPSPSRHPQPSLGPVLSVPDQDGVWVWWRIEVERAEHAVSYGSDSQLDHERRLSRTTKMPWVRIDGLVPGTRYSYRVRSGEFTSDIHRFELPRPEDAFRVAVWADNQNGVDTFTHRTIPALARARPQFLLGLGDYVQDGFRAKEWETQFLSPAAELLRTVPLFPARGNHDGIGKLARAMLPLPDDLGWYAVTLGPIRLVVLDTNLPCGDISPQGTWLRTETAGHAWLDAEFRLVAFHHSPFSVLWDEAGYDGEPGVRTDIVPVIEAAGVDLVLSGHAHAYERLRRKRPDGGIVEYVVLGGGGGALDTVRSADWPGLVKAEPRHHIAVIEVTSKRLHLRVIDTGSGDSLDDLRLGE